MVIDFSGKRTLCRKPDWRRLCISVIGVGAIGRQVSRPAGGARRPADPADRLRPGRGGERHDAGLSAQRRRPVEGPGDVGRHRSARLQMVTAPPAGDRRLLLRRFDLCVRGVVAVGREPLRVLGATAGCGGEVLRGALGHVPRDPPALRHDSISLVRRRTVWSPTVRSTPPASPQACCCISSPAGCVDPGRPGPLLFNLLASEWTPS